MANELQLRIGVKFEKSPLQAININPSVINVTVTGSDYAYQTQNVGTSAENLDKGDITSPGYCLMHNLDSSNFVEVGYDDSGFKPTIKLKALEWALFRFTQTTPQVKADSSACNIEYFLVED